MFTVLFGELFGGAIAGDVKAYLPTIVPGLIIMNALTTSQSTGVDLRENMNKGISTLRLMSLRSSSVRMGKRSSIFRKSLLWMG